MSELCFSMRNVTKWHRYEKMTADRISFSVEKGESVLITGCQGEELKEWMDLATGFIRPDEGSVKRVLNYGIIPEIFPEMEYMDVTDYALLPFVMKGESKRTAWDKVRSFLIESGLMEKKDLKAGFLTKYEQCVLMAVMALAGKPDFLIMGNCTRFLDTEEKMRFWKLLRIWLEELHPAFLCFSGIDEVPYPFKKRYRLCDGHWAVETETDSMDKIG